MESLRTRNPHVDVPVWLSQFQRGPGSCTAAMSFHVVPTVEGVLEVDRARRSGVLSVPGGVTVTVAVSV